MTVDQFKQQAASIGDEDVEVMLELCAKVLLAECPDYGENGKHAYVIIREACKMLDIFV